MQYGSISGADVTGADQGSVAGSAAVVITTYNHARFLGDALESCFGQSRRPAEIVVVDDGSTDDPASVVARFPGVRYVRQDQRGCAAARNAGLAVVTAPYVIFLDADDRLLPPAVETGLRTAAQHPDAAIVYGGFRLVDAELRPIFRAEVRLIEGDPYLALLRGNLIGAVTAVMFRRDLIVKEGGFDERLRLVEDYDLYLRLTRHHPIAAHRQIVAEYRKHGQNISDNAQRMLAAALGALDRQAGFAASYPGGAAALAEGRRLWRAFFALRAWKGVAQALVRPARRKDAMRLLREGLSMGPHFAALGAARWVVRQSGRIIPRGGSHGDQAVTYHVPRPHGGLGEDHRKPPARMDAPDGQVAMAARRES
jgi:glycosyltransferase involved in cell wall biosynthesis